MSDEQSDNRRSAGPVKTARKKRSSVTRTPRKEAGQPLVEDQSEPDEPEGDLEANPMEAAPAAKIEVKAPVASSPASNQPDNRIQVREPDPKQILEREQEREGRGNRAAPNQPSRTPSQQPKPIEGTEFSIQVLFDRVAKQFIATVLEFPDVKVTGPSRDTVIRELEVKVEDKLLSLRETNQPIPDPLGAKRYPDTLLVRPSQALFRKLDLLSKQERTELSELAGELLAVAVERRYEQLGGARQAQAPQLQPPQHQGGGQPRHHQGGDRNRNRDQGQGQQQQQGQGQQGQGNRGGRGGRMSQSNYQNTMSNRENFMEYVRNLEKGGPGWKKR